MADREFDFLRRLIYQQFGISLDEGKRAMLVGRLARICHLRGLPSFDAYCDLLRRGAGREELSELVDHVSTNHTYFNREPEQWAFLTGSVLPELVRTRRQQAKRELRVWCAAASTGQEPYYVAMLMRETIGAEYGSWAAGLLATDISEKALRAARAGIYDADELKSLPAALRARYVRRLADGRFQIVDAVRRDVLYRRLNLVQERYPFKRPFDVILCRNVMIYFDGPTKKRVVGKLVRWLVPGGFLFVGLTEPIDVHGNPQLERVAPAIYRRR